MTDHRADRGSATVWLLMAATVVAAFATASVGLGSALVARHRAEAAADASALAAALHVFQGPAAACQAGAVMAGSDGARQVRCTVTGPFASVEVQVALPGLLERWGPARARARAGPDRDLPGPSPALPALVTNALRAGRPGRSVSPSASTGIE